MFAPLFLCLDMKRHLQFIPSLVLFWNSFEKQSVLNWFQALEHVPPVNGALCFKPHRYVQLLCSVSVCVCIVVAHRSAPRLADSGLAGVEADLPSAPCGALLLRGISVRLRGSCC